jgi:hypothetical protein
LKQEDNIKLCTSLDDIKNMGVSTYLYFKAFKNIGILITILMIIYGGFALATNVIASNVDHGQDYNIDYLSISLGSKQ